MSTITTTPINAIVEPSFGMSVAAPYAAWDADAAMTDALAGAARHTSALSTGVVGNGNDNGDKRRFGHGSPAWRSPDC